MPSLPPCRRAPARARWLLPLALLAHCVSPRATTAVCTSRSDCTQGRVCNSAGQCVPECATDLDCRDPRNPASFDLRCLSPGPGLAPVCAIAPASVGDATSTDASEAQAPPPDASPEASLDAGPDTSPEASTDAAPDVAADVAPDAPPTLQAVGTTVLVSVSMDGAGSANGGSYEPRVSADGRYVAFSSSAQNLSATPSAGNRMVYLRDQWTGATRQMVVPRVGLGTFANGDCAGVELSGDGRYVAFGSQSSNLVADDTNGTPDVFVADRDTGAITRLSLRASGAQAGNTELGLAGFSLDGRVALIQTRDALVASDSNGEFDLYARYWQETPPRTVAVSVSTAGTFGVASTGTCGPGGANAGTPVSSLSGDGRYVGFDSSGTQLVAGANTQECKYGYRRDLVAGTTELVSPAVGGPGAARSNPNILSTAPVFSGDGRSYAFASSYDFPSMGARSVTTQNVWLHTSEGQLLRVTTAAGGGDPNDDASVLNLSNDGRYVLFASAATNLVSGDNNGLRDLFVFDAMTRTIARVNLDNAGGELHANTLDGRLSSDGRFVAFATMATIASTDANSNWDVYLRRLR